MTKRGRPPVSESAMLAVWRLVREEMHREGHANVSKACTAVMKRAKRGIRFKDPSLPPEEKLTDAIMSVERLRKRYYQAEQSRHDAATYPLLNARAAILEQTLPHAGLRHRLMGMVYREMELNGYAREGSTLPLDEKLNLALFGLYYTKSKRRPPFKKRQKARRAA